MSYHGRGLADAGTAAQGVQIGSSIGTPIATAVAAPAVGTALGLSASLAVPIVGAAFAGITIAVIKLIQNSGCGPTCIQASDYANQAELLLRQNLNAYFSLPVPRAQSAQAAYLANFDAIWAQYVKLESDPALGNAGKRGISDRQAGACTWKQTADYGPAIMAAGEPAMGQCWNWFSGYRDPIQNDPNVVPDSQASAASGSVLSGGSLLPIAVLAGVGLILWGLS